MLRDGRYTIARRVDGDGGRLVEGRVVRGHLVRSPERLFRALDAAAVTGAPRSVPAPPSQRDAQCIDAETFAVERDGRLMDGSGARSSLAALAAEAEADVQAGMANADSTYGTHAPLTPSTWMVSVVVVGNDDGGQSAMLWFAANGRWLCASAPNGHSTMALGHAPELAETLRASAFSPGGAPSAGGVWAPLPGGRTQIMLRDAYGEHGLATPEETARALTRLSEVAAVLDPACDLRPIDTP